MAYCPVCSTKASEPFAHVGSYTQYECQQCQLWFSDPMQNPGAEWYQQFSLYSHAQKKEPAPMYLIGRDWRCKQFFPLGLHPGGRLLDLGCGSGELLKLAEEHGYVVTGVDFSGSSLQAARSLYGLQDLRESFIEDFLRTTDEQFDVIWLFSVLEHVDNPHELVSLISRRLAPGGYFVCTVPSNGRWPRWFDDTVDTPPHHLTLWSEPALRRCLTDAGLNVASITPSPLLAEHLLFYANLRWPFLRRSDLIGSGFNALGYWGVFPVVAGILRIIKPTTAGGFILMSSAQRPEL